MKIKKLIEELKKLKPDGTIFLFEYKNDQSYRISELPTELGGGIYQIGIEKTEKPKEA